MNLEWIKAPKPLLKVTSKSFIMLSFLHLKVPTLSIHYTKNRSSRVYFCKSWENNFLSSLLPLALITHSKSFPSPLWLYANSYGYLGKICTMLKLVNKTLPWRTNLKRISWNKSTWKPWVYKYGKFLVASKSPLYAVQISKMGVHIIPAAYHIVKYKQINVLTYRCIHGQYNHSNFLPLHHIKPKLLRPLDSPIKEISGYIKNLSMKLKETQLRRHKAVKKDRERYQS